MSVSREDRDELRRRIAPATRTYFMQGAWDLSPDGKPGIWRDDPDGGDPHPLALISRVYDAPRLYAAFTNPDLIIGLLDQLDAAEAALEPFAAAADAQDAADARCEAARAATGNHPYGPNPDRYEPLRPCTLGQLRAARAALQRQPAAPSSPTHKAAA